MHLFQQDGTRRVNLLVIFILGKGSSLHGDLLKNGDFSPSVKISRDIGDEFT